MHVETSTSKFPSSMLCIQSTDAASYDLNEVDLVEGADCNNC